MARPPMAALRAVQMLGVKIDDSPTTLKAVRAAILENGHMHRSDTPGPVGTTCSS